MLFFIMHSYLDSYVGDAIADAAKWLLLHALCVLLVPHTAADHKFVSCALLHCHLQAD